MKIDGIEVEDGDKVLIPNFLVHRSWWRRLLGIPAKARDRVNGIYEVSVVRESDEK